MRIDLRGAAAIITGASGGIGSATARAFAANGTNVVLAALAEECSALNAVAAEVSALGARAIVVPADVTNRGDVDAIVRAALQTFGKIDILANIAGIGSSPSIADSTDQELERVIAVNLLGCARMIHAVLPTMKAERRGSIINMGSIAGKAGVMGIYSASKFGLRGLSDTLRREVRSYNIGVTLIQPGFVRTQMNAAMSGLPGPEIVADAVVDAVRRPRRSRVVPARYHVPLFIATAFPWLTDLVFGDARIQARLNRDARAAREAANS